MNTGNYSEGENLLFENIIIADNFNTYSVKLGEFDICANAAAPPVNETFLSWMQRECIGLGNIMVIKGDTLDVATRVLETGSNVVILNFANNIIAGGGFQLKGHTQEETLMKRTTIAATLPKSMYPIDQYEDKLRYYHYKKLALIYSPEVWILRNKNNEYLRRPVRVSAITCAAINNPRQTGNEYTYESDKNVTTRKIHMILATCQQYGINILIAGLWGVGAFGNPLEICKIWRSEAANFPNIWLIFPIIGDGADDFVKGILATEKLN